MHFCLINRWKAKITADLPFFLELTDYPWTGPAASSACPHKTDDRPCMASVQVWLFRYAAKSRATAHRYPLGHTPTGSFFRKSQCRPIIIRYLWSGSGTIAYPCGLPAAPLPPKQRAAQSSRIAVPLPCGDYPATLPQRAQNRHSAPPMGISQERTGNAASELRNICGLHGAS